MGETITVSKWGFLRETREQAQKAGVDAATGLPRTGMEDYLAVIFPDTNDWIHSKAIGNGSRKAPDYRSESLKLIIEIDGLPHYQNPCQIRTDETNTRFYENLGYKVVRIPYFIQLTNDAVKTMFGIDVDEPLFDPTCPSIGINKRNTPAYLCHQGIKRMAAEFKKYPEQYAVTLEFMKKQKDQYLVEYELLEKEYDKV